MKKIRMMSIVLFLTVLLLSGAAGRAETTDFSGIAGVWYTEEYMMQITEDGRFTVEWNDGDWVGSLEADERTNEDDEDYTAWRMIPNDPEISLWEELELIPDIHHPGKTVFYGDESPLGEFYNVPVYVKEVSDEELEYYEPYTLIDDADGEEPAATVMFTLLRPATDIAVLKMFDQEIDSDGNLAYNADALAWWPELDSQERILVTHVFEGDLPELALHMITEDGIPSDFAIQISGYDGEPDLLQLPGGDG